MACLAGFASPFFLRFYAWYFLRGEFGEPGSRITEPPELPAVISEAAALNPHDGDAQYQLGLIYQQRRQFTEAARRFQNAVTIDPSQTDAHFQLGRIAREQGRLKDALVHFETVVNQDGRHSQSEILRELGALYISARQFEDARNELSRIMWNGRPYNPEGLFHYGQALEGLGNVWRSPRGVWNGQPKLADLAPPYPQTSRSQLELAGAQADSQTGSLDARSGFACFGAGAFVNGHHRGIPE